MGNKQLRPSEEDPLKGFDDQQLLYLTEKFELISNESGFIDVAKLSEAYQCSPDEAQNILKYIDFEGEGQVDFYEFKCAAASIHQNDEEAEEMIFGIYAESSGEMTREHFDLLFKTVYRYLTYVNLNKETYSEDVGKRKFEKYDFNNNGSISLQQFRSILKKDPECRKWMGALGFVEEDEEVRNKDEREEKIEQKNQQGDFEVEDETGDEAGCSPSWIKTIDYMKPKGYVAPSNLNTPPSTNIEIEYIYGYRSYDTRNNLRYSPKGEAVYHTAGVGIVLNQTKNTMRVTTVHNDDITCLDTWKNLVVTAEMGRRPLIAVWDTETMETVMTFSKPLQKSISNVAFSPSGKYIAATSMNDNHEIAVYDVAKKCLLATGNGPRSPIFALKFTQSEDQVVCGCAKQVVFASFASGKGIKLDKGIFGKVPIIPTYSLARVNNYMVSGMGNGNILLWKGTSCTKPLKQHNVAVSALCETINGGLISGDAEGNIVIWNSDLTVERKLSIIKLISPKVSFQPKIIALAHRQGALLAGTRGGEVVEVLLVNPAKANVIMQGHYDKQLWGLTTYPNKNEFFTAGQDRLLIKWDIAKRRAIDKRQLESAIMSVDLNLKTNTIAVGFRNGAVTFLDCTSMKSMGKINNHKNPDKEVLSLVKYSPNGQLLAVSYCPPVSKVYLYNTTNLKKVGECKGSPSRITSIDYSMSSDFMLVNNTSYEILFYNTKNGAQNTRATQFQEQRWASMSCKFSWMCQGIWPHLYADGSDINTVERSHSNQLLATGDDFSKIKLFRYPACIPKQFYNQYKGHSSHVTGVKWSFDDKYLITIGGLEKSVIQWKVDAAQDVVYEYDQEKTKQPEEQEEKQEQYDLEAEQQEVVEQKTKKKGDEDGDDFEVDEQQGDQAGAVKPFLGQIKNPSNFVFNKTQLDVLPKESLALEYAWGIRNQYITDEVRNQLKYNAKGTSCIYITASLGVQMDIKTLKQQFYNIQTNDLICMAISSNREIIATGQMAELNQEKRSIPKVDVHIWSVEDKKTLNVLKCCHQRAVVVVEFSPNGQLLLTIGQDDKNTAKVFNWKSNNLQWPEQPTSRAKATGACWKNNKQYATVGLDHIKFWADGKGSMGKLTGKWDPMFCVTQIDGKYISGGGSGAIYTWGGGSGTKIEAHKNGKVHALLVDSKKNLYSGGDDGSIIYWKASGNSLTKQVEIVNMGKLSSLLPGVLSLDINKSEDRLLVCTKGSEIFEVNLKKPMEENCLMKSHFAGELWACTFSPESDQFVTAGDDKTLRVYNVSDRKMQYSYKMANMVRSVDWQQSAGELIVCGDYKGKIFLFNNKLQLLDQGKTRFSRMKPRQSPYWIEDIKFSPDGKYVAFGAHGGRSHIEIFTINGNKFGESFVLGVGFTSALLHLDWSKDSSSLVSVSQAYELKFARVDKSAGNKADISATALKDEQWATWTCKFGFPVQGIWQGVDYTDINTVCASPSRQLLVTGGDDQIIRLFKYPAVVPKQKNKAYIGHASHVTRVRFSHDQEHLLSTGGNDRTTILWNVVGGGKPPAPKKELEKEEEEQEVEREQGGNEDDVDQNEIDVPIDRHDVKAQDEASKKQKNEDDFEVDEDTGDQFMAVKPWIGAIKQPTKPFYKNNGDEPKIKLQLEYAHGYRTKDCRNNLRFLDEKTIAYHTAGIGVVMDITTKPRTQSFFIKHNDDILSMAWTADRKTMYTGELGPNPAIYEWDSSCSSERCYKGLKKGVVALDCNEKYLVGAALDDDHNVMVFDRKSCKVVAKEKGGRQFIIALKFLGEDTFVSVGVKHYKLWQIKGATLKATKGQFGKNCDILCCVDISKGKIYVGAGDGSLQVWTGNSCGKAVSLHDKKPMDAIRCLENVVLTGGKDGTVKIVALDSLAVLATVNCKDLFKDSKCPSVRAIDVFDNQLLVGTLGSQIYQITCDSPIEESKEGADFSNVQRLMSGHYSPNAKWTNEVWGLAIPGLDGEHFTTCSDDATVRIWDLEKKEEIASERIDFDEKLKVLKKDPKTGDYQDQAKGRCVGLSRDGYVLVGCKDGTVKILDENLKPVSSQSIAKKEISDIKFNREDNMVAIGAHDATIYLCSWEAPTLKVKYRMKKHSSYITHLDFSCDGNYLHSTCGAYELLFWDTSKGQQCTSGATMLRDQFWNTWTTTLGWPVQGIWSKFMDGTDINAVDRSRQAYEKDKRYIATGNDRGEVRVFEYPCILKDSKSIVGKGHSSHVTCVRFTDGDKYLISSGGEDQTIMQWRVQPS